MPSKQYSAIAFDLHDVLFARNYKRMLSLLLTTPRKRRLCTTVLKPSFLYDLFCLYQKTRVAEHYILNLGTKYPTLHDYIDHAIAITNSLIPSDEMFALIHQLKEQGYALYIFSNIGQKTYHELLKEHAPLFTAFDGIHVTHAHNNWVQKPFFTAYQQFMQRFDLDPTRIIFIDDKKDNTQAAQQCGITAICFKSLQQLQNSLLTLGVL